MSFSKLCDCETGAPYRKKLCRKHYYNKLTVTLSGLKIVSVLTESENCSRCFIECSSQLQCRTKMAIHDLNISHMGHCFGKSETQSLLYRLNAVPSVLISSFFMESALSENVLKYRLVISSYLIPFRSYLRRLAIPFFSRITILRSLLDIFLLCLEFKSCCSTLIHQVPFHPCLSSPSSPRLQKAPPSSILVSLNPIRWVCSSSLMILASKLIISSRLPRLSSVGHLSLPRLALAFTRCAWILLDIFCFLLHQKRMVAFCGRLFLSGFLPLCVSERPPFLPWLCLSTVAVLLVVGPPCMLCAFV